jgi:protein TonB
MRAFVLALLAALALHGLVLLFGGVFFFTDEELKDRGAPREVELFENAELEAEKPPEDVEDLEARKPEDLEVAEEKPPEMRELFREEPTPDAPTAADTVARLDALSLSALESALSGAGGTGSDGFGVGASLASGGRIGGTGAPGSGGDLEGDALHDVAFDIAELDQRARPIVQAAPVYPAALRAKKTEGTVYVVFVVDAEGRVQQPKVEKSTHEEFDRAALDAVRHWRFEPAVRGGSKVPSKMRIPIRFSVPS